MSDIDNHSINADSKSRMPVLFIGHGSPMNAIEENEFVAGWRQVAGTIQRPSAVLCISAHWETYGTYVTSMKYPRTIHDFGGFPQELYEIQYPAPGDPGLAARTRDIIKNGITLDNNWGLDHGTWSVIRHFYPHADIPVIQLSLNYNKTPRQHFEMAQEMRKLRDQNVLVIGSGNMVHNLSKISWDKIDEPGFGYDWAIEANDRMKEFILSGDYASLMNYKDQGTAFDLAIPSPEHFLPLLYTLALKEEKDDIEIFNDKAVAGSLTMTSLKIGNIN